MGLEAAFYMSLCCFPKAISFEKETLSFQRITSIAKGIVGDGEVPNFVQSEKRISSDLKRFYNDEKVEIQVKETAQKVYVKLPERNSVAWNGGRVTKRALSRPMEDNKIKASRHSTKIRGEKQEISSQKKAIVDIRKALVKLKILGKEVRDVGYVPETKYVLHNIDASQ